MAWLGFGLARFGWLLGFRLEVAWLGSAWVWLALGISVGFRFDLWTWLDFNLHSLGFLVGFNWIWLGFALSLAFNMIFANSSPS